MSGLRQRIGVTGAAWLAVGLLAACGDAADRCPIEEPWNDPPRAECISARALAARDSSNLVVSREDMDWHQDVYRRGFGAFDEVMASPPRAQYWWTLIVIVTDDPRFSAPWTTGQVMTGVPDVDDVLRRAYVSKVDAVPAAHAYGLSSRRWIVPRAFAAELGQVTTLAVQVEPTIFTQTDDVVIESHAEGSDVLSVVYQRGWGDCFVNCAGRHWWRVRVTPDDATLVEEWGDVVPDDVLESWRIPVPDQ